jgi:hypothetical protein
VVHVHDIFFPGDYPETWVMQGRGWNEAYLVRSFLEYNDSFEIIWGTQFMLQRYPEALQLAFPNLDLSPTAGASIWFRRTRGGPGRDAVDVPCVA